MITSQQLHAHHQVNTTLLVAGLVLLDSMHFVFARLLLPRIAPGASVTYVLAVSTLEVGVFGLVQRRLHWQTAKRHLWLFVVIGLLIALSTAGNYEAVAFIDPGTASLLSQSSVLFNIAFGVLWMGDRLSTKQIWGALLAIIGVFVISYQPGEYLRLGALVIILSSLMYALHAALAKQHAGKIDFVDFFFFRLLFTTLTLVLLATVRGVFTVPDLPTWGLIALVGTADVVLSRTLYYLALRRLRLSMHTIVLTLSPLASVLWAFLLFGVYPRLQQILGGVAVIIGVSLVSLARRDLAPDVMASSVGTTGHGSDDAVDDRVEGKAREVRLSGVPGVSRPER